MKKTIYFLLIALTCTTYSCSSDDDIANNDKATTTLVLSHQDKKHTDSINILMAPYVSFIANTNEVHSGLIGVGLGSSIVYEHYKGLQEVSNINDLYPLLKHDSAAVRVYAYLAIVAKDSTLCESAWDRMKGKKEPVQTLFACKGKTMPIDEVINEWLPFY